MLLNKRTLKNKIRCHKTIFDYDNMGFQSILSLIAFRFENIKLVDDMSFDL